MLLYGVVVIFLAFASLALTLSSSLSCHFFAVPAWRDVTYAPWGYGLWSAEAYINGSFTCGSWGYPVDAPLTAARVFSVVSMLLGLTLVIAASLWACRRNKYQTYAKTLVVLFLVEGLLTTVPQVALLSKYCADSVDQCFYGSSATCELIAAFAWIFTGLILSCTSRDKTNDEDDSASVSPVELADVPKQVEVVNDVETGEDDLEEVHLG